MKLSTWRNLLSIWLSRKLTVGSYDLRNPEPADNGSGLMFIPPLNNVYYAANGGTLFGYATQDIHLSYWYPSSLKYSDLPLGALEGIHSTISQYFLRDSAGIAPLVQLQLIKLQKPVSLRESGDKLADWIVDLVWSISITWVAELETEDSTGTYSINEFILSLYEHTLTDSRVPTPFTDNNKVLDYRLDKLKETS